MKLKIRDIAVFSMLGALMYASKLLMDLLPNIHLIGVFTVAFTVYYRRRALYPIYVFVFLTLMVNGFSAWLLPYLYVWTVLWGAVMLLPRNMPEKARPFVYSGVCGLHGLLFGVLYAPAQALLFGLSFKQMLAWIAAGLPYDAIHGVSNIICGALICPVIKILERTDSIKK